MENQSQSNNFQQSATATVTNTPNTTANATSSPSFITLIPVGAEPEVGSAQNTIIGSRHPECQNPVQVLRMHEYDINCDKKPDVNPSGNPNLDAIGVGVPLFNIGIKSSAISTTSRSDNNGLPVEMKTVFKSPPPPPPSQSPQHQQQQAQMANTNPSQMNRLALDGSTEEPTNISSSQSNSTICSDAIKSKLQQPPQAAAHSAASQSQPQPSTSTTSGVTTMEPINVGATTSSVSDAADFKLTSPSGGPQSRKRKKNIKKGAKLDVKLKLEKSRQSARECRARKKLRYQYLEDLVCNREKAVMILREELVKFCDIAQQLDAGSTISESSLKLVKEQAKENNHLEM